MEKASESCETDKPCPVSCSGLLRGSIASSSAKRNNADPAFGCLVAGEFERPQNEVWRKELVRVFSQHSACCFRKLGEFRTNALGGKREDSLPHRRDP